MPPQLLGADADFDTAPAVIPRIGVINQEKAHPGKKIDELRASDTSIVLAWRPTWNSNSKSWASLDSPPRTACATSKVPSPPRSARAPSPKATVLTHQHAWLLVLVPARRDMKPETGHPTGKSTTNRITRKPRWRPGIEFRSVGV